VYETLRKKHPGRGTKLCQAIIWAQGRKQQTEGRVLSRQKNEEIKGVGGEVHWPVGEEIEWGQYGLRQCKGTKNQKMPSEGGGEDSYWGERNR